jgi:hypothetical protein
MPKTKSPSLIRTGVALAAGLALYHVMVRPWQRDWGATQAELGRALPGDELVRGVTYQTTRAITIRAPAAQVWPWLVQIGYGRGGFYSYDWLENMSGLEIASADRIVAEHQALAVGDRVHIAPETPLTVTRLEPSRTLVLHTVMNPFTAQPVDVDAPSPGSYINWTWAFLLNELSDRTTRLVIRVRAGYQPRCLAPLVYTVLEPAHFVMERKMLLGIKARVEKTR